MLAARPEWILACRMNAAVAGDASCRMAIPIHPSSGSSLPRVKAIVKHACCSPNAQRIWVSRCVPGQPGEPRHDHPGRTVRGRQDLLVPQIEETMRRRSFAGLGDAVALHVTTFGRQVGVIGAAALALDAFFYRQDALQAADRDGGQTEGGRRMVVAGSVRGPGRLKGRAEAFNSLRISFVPLGRPTFDTVLAGEVTGECAVRPRPPAGASSAPTLSSTPRRSGAPTCCVTNRSICC